MLYDQNYADRAGIGSVVPGTGTPVYWNGKLYFTSKSKVEMYPLNQGMLDSPTLSTWVRAEGIQLSARMGAMMEFSGILAAAEYCLRWMQRP
jgi:hypothetical protein